MKGELNNLLDKRMNRLDFLKHVGVGVAALTGVATVVSTMNSLGSKKQQANVSAGYGASVYGGTKPRSS